MPSSPKPPSAEELHHHVTEMGGRDPHEENRTATPLELLFDLTFVIAFGLAASQLAHALAIARIHAHADAHRSDERAAVDDDRRAQRLIDSSGGVIDLARTLHVLQHDDEFVATHADHNVFVAHSRANARSNRLQQLVARFMAA